MENIKAGTKAKEEIEIEEDTKQKMPRIIGAFFV